MVSSAYCAGVFAQYSRECYCTGLLPTEQNRFLLTEKDTGALTVRGKKILDHTPMGRFGTPEDLPGCGTVAAFPGVEICYRNCSAYRWGFSSFFWSVTKNEYDER